ncbi:hypothetical protein KUTeg_003336 [Tegillarca granosa]|uniref:Uncharacterized protein n=1 Tax=Tegillarca granosa TaxID=220873 RepID=A0ABQ9FLV0_TEGGR|nr:hypothetical protein KUTeg_003336 [Tegillarca granosa]
MFQTILIEYYTHLTILGVAMIAHMKSSDWLHTLFTKTEDEVLQMIKTEPGLADLQLQFKCQLEGPGSSKKPCQCCINFETLQPDSFSIDEMIIDFKRYLQTGYCHHLSEQDEDGGYDVAKISVSHIAAAFGKLKILKEVLPKYSGTSSEFWRDYNLKYSTGVIGLNPLQLSILHLRFNAFSLVLKRCKYFAQTKLYSFKTFPDIGVSCGHCITLAAEHNFCDFLQLIAHHCIDLYSVTEILDGFFVALYFRSYGCCDLLLSMVNRSWPYPVSSFRLHQNILHFLSDSKDEKMFCYLIQLKYLDTTQCISHFIRKGQEKHVKKLFIKRKQKGLKDPGEKLYYKQNIPFIIQALFHDGSLEMLQIILKYGSKKEIQKTCSANEYSGMDWALALQHGDAEKLLRLHNIKANQGIEKINPPLIAIFDYYQIFVHTESSVYIDFINFMKKLINLGHNVNAETPNGTTPLLRAASLTALNKEMFLPILRLLLINGADPYKGNASPHLYVDNYIITEFLYCNVNMCINNFMSSILRNILVTNYSGYLINLILKYSHTIPAHYKRALNHLHAIPSGFISVEELDMADDLFINPRSLLILCRNSIRRSYGYKIHEFLKQKYLPLQIKKILTLEDELKEDGIGSPSQNVKEQSRDLSGSSSQNIHQRSENSHKKELLQNKLDQRHHQKLTPLSMILFDFFFFET